MEDLNDEETKPLGRKHRSQAERFQTYLQRCAPHLQGFESMLLLPF